MESLSVVRRQPSQESAALLLEVVEVLLNEIAIVSNRQWDELPGLKRKKTILASRLRALTATPGFVISDEFQALISRLETHSGRLMELQANRMSRQILALQELSQYCRECLNVSFRKFF